MSREDERTLSTADIARGAAPHRDEHAQEHEMHGMGEQQHSPQQQQPSARAEPLAALFPPQMADDYRRRWDTIQIGFVDDPRAAVHNADELVAHVLRSLAESFA